jgi:hypothetical protein
MILTFSRQTAKLPVNWSLARDSLLHYAARTAQKWDDPSHVVGEHGRLFVR